MSFLIALNLTLAIAVLIDRLAKIVLARLASRSRCRFEVVVAVISVVAAVAVLYFAPALQDCGPLSLD